jgi:hypothetical protein
MISSFVRRLFDNLLVPDVPVFSKLMYLDKDYLVVACTLSHFVSSIVLLMAFLQHFLDLSTSQDSTWSPVCAAKLPCIGLSYLTKFYFLKIQRFGSFSFFSISFCVQKFSSRYHSSNCFQDILLNSCRGHCIMCGSRPLSCGHL